MSFTVGACGGELGLAHMALSHNLNLNADADGRLGPSRPLSDSLAHGGAAAGLRLTIRRGCSPKPRR